MKDQCTPGKSGKIERSVDEEYVERVRGYHETEPYKKAMRKRQVWIEPLFAEAKAWHGLRRFRLRRLPKVNIEMLLVASTQNIKRLLNRERFRISPRPGGMAGGAVAVCLTIWITAPAATVRAPRREGINIRRTASPVLQRPGRTLQRQFPDIGVTLSVTIRKGRADHGEIQRTGNRVCAD